MVRCVELCRVVLVSLGRGESRGEAGSDDIIKHKWFADIDQDKMLKGEMKSPYQINVKDENDVSNFENIPDSVLREAVFFVGTESCLCACVCCARGVRCHAVVLRKGFFARKVCVEAELPPAVPASADPFTDW